MQCMAWRDNASDAISQEILRFKPNQENWDIFFCVDDRVSIASSEDKTLDRWLPKHRRQEGFAVFGTSAPAVWPILRITRFP